MQEEIIWKSRLGTDKGNPGRELEEPEVCEHWGENQGMDRRLKHNKAWRQLESGVWEKDVKDFILASLHVILNSFKNTWAHSDGLPIHYWLFGK